MALSPLTTSMMPVPAEAQSVPVADVCYHCGEPVPQGLDLAVELDGRLRPMCCPGCRAVACLIQDSGLGSFYRQRTTYNLRPEEQQRDTTQQYQIYDDADLAATFSEKQVDGSLHASLLLGGLSCAACTWLVEHALQRLPGVDTAQVNLEQARLDIRIHPEQIRLSEIFARLNNLGYPARPFHHRSRQTQLQEEYRGELRRLGVAGFGMMQVGMFAIALHAGDIQGMESEYQSLLRSFSLLVASFVVFYSARPFFTSAWRHLRQGALVMDLPVSIAIGLAWLASAWATIKGGGQVYFDSVAMFTFFLLLGRFLESRARHRNAFNWFEDVEALPDAVTVWRDGSWQRIPRFNAALGERVLINAGDTVPVDGRVTSGISAVREDSFSGEHLPRSVRDGDMIFAGTINVEAPLECRVVSEDKDTRYAALQRSVQFARADKPRLAKLADRVAARFVAVILLIAAATGLYWSLIDPQQAFWITLSVLVISCPCALALATPAALTSANNALRRQGVLVKGANALEALSRATHLVFDKTGTLTEGQLRIHAVHPQAAMCEDDILGLGASLQRYSSHPVAMAFSEIAAAGNFENVDYRAGAGLSATMAGVPYRMGSENFCRELAPHLPPPPETAHYWVALVRADEPLAWIGLSDRVRGEAGDVLANARAAGLDIQLLSGDSSVTGPQMARELGISEARFGLAPEQKMQRVRQLQAGGATVCMVGDGLNDAPVLGVADTSFAVAGATDLARTQADFIILGGNLRAVMDTWKVARRCRQIIWQNFAWALGYNLCGIPLAALGLVPPWAAAVGMSASSLLVVLNSLRLNRPIEPYRDL